MRVVVFKKARVLIFAVILIAVCAGVLFALTGREQLPVVNDEEQPIYQGSSDRKEIALTCNVFWGEQFLPSMLEILERHEVPVTFFIGGTWAEKNPNLTRELVRKGHEIGNHGYSHPHPDRLSKQENLEDIEKCGEVLMRITGQRPHLYAPPYGERGPAVLEAAREAGYKTILWSIDTVDWKQPPPEVIVNRIVNNVQNGAIVLMHPTAPIVCALPEIITKVQKKGYSFVTVSELLRESE